MQADHQTLPAEEQLAINHQQCVNMNIGVLGHVDSGKTSLCRVLSEVTSTASLDKNPQSQQRGITLDLGFSAFFTRLPPHLQKDPKKKYLQFTLVDCPGHASLIKTVIGGAQIIDLMFLVIDAVKGIQTQTAECISIAELFIDKMIVVLNKVDLLEDNTLLQKKIEALRKIFGKTKFGSQLPIVCFSAKPGGVDQESVRKLKETLLSQIVLLPERKEQGHFMMLVDHCFPIKGKGSVVTGTTISGRVRPGDQVDFPLSGITKKVKSMQMFKKPVNEAIQGDRVALLFTQLEADQIERGICCEPGYVGKMSNCIISFEKIRYYKQNIQNKAKFHIISGHQTVMGAVRLFYTVQQLNDKQLDFGIQYLSGNSYDQILQQTLGQGPRPKVFALLQFQKDLFANVGSTLVAYRFDGDIQDNVCRLAFHGPILASISTEELKAGNFLKVFKMKTKSGQIDKLLDDHTMIVKNLFKKDVNLNNFMGKPVTIEYSGNRGTLQCPFGNSGKVKAYFEKSILDFATEKKEMTAQKILNSAVLMPYKKYYFSKN